jgi:hypothetical protein
MSERRDSTSVFDHDSPRINRPEATVARGNITTINPLTGVMENPMKSTIPKFRGIKCNMIKQPDNIKKIGDQSEYEQGWERDWVRKSRETSLTHVRRSHS